MAKSLHPFSLVFALGLIMGSMVVAQPSARPQKIKTIIIDAGHGGTDPGARGEYSTEAQITLQIAQRLDTLLRNEISDTRIVMTRNTDVYHSVTEKANFANRENGDLFVCIHVNAAPKEKAVKEKNTTGKCPFMLPHLTLHTELLPMFGLQTGLMKKQRVSLMMKDMNPRLR